MKVYEALYCGCIHESSYATISLHLSKEGAEKAIKKHRLEELKKQKQIYKSLEIKQTNKELLQHQDWFVKETEILP